MKDPKHALDWFRRKKSSPKLPASTPLSSAQDTAANSGNTSDWVIDGFTFALDLAEQALDIVEVAPIIGPAAALIHKIIDTYKEWKDIDEKHDLLAKRVTDITGDLCATVLRMQEMSHSDQIRRLRRDLETYAVLINTASQFIKDYGDQGTLTHFAGRNQMRDEFDKLQHDLDLFGARFRNNRLMDLCIQESTNTQTLEKVYDAVTKKKLEEWLQCPPDMRQKQHDTEKLRTEGTGQWFLEDKRFIEWQDNPGVLWVEGPSGAGKSVISSTVISDLFVHQTKFTAQAHPFAVAFFYFDFRNKDTQNVETALCRIVLQLSAQSPYPYKTLDQHWELSKGQRLPSYRDLICLLFKLLHELGHTYIVLDALDECDSNSFQDLVGLVVELRAWAQTPLHLCITGQPRDEFTQGFKGITQIVLAAKSVDKDIKSFITVELANNGRLKQWKLHSDQVTMQVAKKASGMFRLAACLLTELSHCRRPKDEKLNEILEKLPETLVGVYDRFLQAIEPEDFPDVQGALQWIIFNNEPWDLTLAKLADAITFDCSSSVQYIYMPDWQESSTSLILEGLAGLIQISDQLVVRLAHASVHEYLFSDHFRQKFSCDLREGYSHSFLARGSISYLLYLANNIAEEQIEEDKYPLGEYAAENWYHHILRSDDQKTLLDLGMQLLQDRSKQYQTLCRLQDESEDLPPLFVCCRQGYLEYALQLIENGADVNMVGGPYGSPLGTASYCGKLDIVHLLLEKGADVNLISQQYGSPLAAASDRGNMDIVQMLLEKGANINLVDGQYGSALSAVSYRGRPEIVQLLLKKGADINLVGGEYGNALGAACYGNELGIVKLLLEKGADINKAGGKYGSALAAAAASKFDWNSPLTELVGLLLENGADVKAQGGRALEEALENGYNNVAALLQEHGAVLEEEDNSFDSVSKS